MSSLNDTDIGTGISQERSENQSPKSEGHPHSAFFHYNFMGHSSEERP